MNRFKLSVLSLVITMAIIALFTLVAWLIRTFEIAGWIFTTIPVVATVWVLAYYFLSSTFKRRGKQ